MAKLSSLHDFVQNTLATYERNKYDSVGIAQLYPELEVVKQFVTGKKALRDMSDRIKTALEIGAPSSYEHSYTNHPAQTSAPKLTRWIETPMVKVRTKMTYSNDEKELQGASETKLIDVVQQRMVKFQRDYWEGLEHDFLSAPSGPDQHPDQLRGLKYWVTAKSGQTSGVDMNGGDDPAGFSAGAGGLTKAQEPRWPNATGVFAKVTQDDYFDKIDRFLNDVYMQAIVPHPSVAPEVPSRVIYVQEPVKRAVGRVLTASNEDVGVDLGVYKDANVYRSMPVTIWHALSKPGSPVKSFGQSGVGVSMLVDWNAFMYQLITGYDRKRTGPHELPDIPGQYVLYEESWMALHCVRRDRNLRLQTSTAELIPA